MAKTIDDVLNDIANGIGWASTEIQHVEDPDLRWKLIELVNDLFARIDTFKNNESGS